MIARPPWGAQTRIVTGILVAGLVAGAALDLSWQQLRIGEGGLRLAGEMLSAAVRPALFFEGRIGESDPGGPVALLPLALAAAGRTVTFAVAACSLALVVALPLACLSSRVFWTLARGHSAGRPSRLRGAIRGLAAGLRSIHELLWAVLLLAALGLSDATAVIALAIPYIGVFTKIFAELLDEAPKNVAASLSAMGAQPAAALLWGVLPQALPDMVAYVLYRFECALRSSAVLGFFGFPTLGYEIAASFENLHYREMWSFIYVLLALILAVDAWSAVVRRRWVG